MVLPHERAKITRTTRWTRDGITTSVGVAGAEASLPELERSLEAGNRRRESRWKHWLASAVVIAFLAFVLVCLACDLQGAPEAAERLFNRTFPVVTGVVGWLFGSRNAGRDDDRT